MNFHIPLAYRVTMATLSPSQYESLRKYSSQQSILNTEVQMKGSLPLSPNKNSTLNEIKVFTADNKFVMVPLHNATNTPADSILELALPYVNIEVEAGRDIFALWIVSTSLELQLKPTHKPVRLLQQWLATLNSYTDMTISESIKEQPALLLKRSSYLQLKVERGVKNPAAQFLLFCEAKNNFIKARYVFSEMREVLKLGAYLYLADEVNQSDLALESLMYNTKINNYLPIKSQRIKSPLDVSTKAKKCLLSKQLCNAIQTQLMKGHNCANFRTLFLQACQNLAVYGAVFFDGVVERPVSLFSRLTRTKSDRQVFVALNVTTLHILDSTTNEVLFKLYYDHFSWLYQPPSKNGEDDQFCCIWIEFDSVLDNSLSVAKQLQIFSKQASLIDSLINHHVVHLSHKAPNVEDNDRPQPISALVIHQPFRTPHVGEGNFSLHAFSLDGEEIPRSKIKRGMSTFKKSISS